MRKPITQASFAPHVQGWSFEAFKERFQSQMTNEEIEYFAKELGIKKAGKHKPESSTPTATPADKD